MSERIWSLSCRCWVVRKTLRPFCFYEFLEFTDQKGLLDDILNIKINQPINETLHSSALNQFFLYMTAGGFAEAISNHSDTAKTHEYLETLLSFFYKDADRYLSEITGSEKFQYGRLFETVVKAIARHAGSPTKRSSLVSTDSPAYRHELPALLNAIEDWHFMFRLPTMMKTMTTKQGSSSKKYLWDVGITNHILNLNRPIGFDSDSQLMATLLETTVAQELIFYLQTADRLFSWKSNQKQSREMDFLARFPREDVGIEVKASKTISKNAISQMYEFIKVSPQAKKWVIYLGNYQRVSSNGEDIHFIPPYLLGSYCHKSLDLLTQ